MNVGSLFAGIGGFDLGLERAGFEIAWQVELDPFCRAVLARRFPAARRLEDVREVGAAELGPVDLICGGFPCQDLSVAGGGAGLEGARSGLWAEFARLVRELGPRYVLVENVPALLSGKGRRWDRAPIGRVLGDLAEAGYDAEWACLSAREFGAPHLRRRVWVLAYPGPDLPDTERLRTGHLALRRGGRQGRQAAEPSHQRFYDRASGRVVQKTLEHIALTWPTPTATDARKGYSSAPGPGNGRGRQTLSGAVHSRARRRGPRGHLNPEWVEWLMGFPIGWSASPRSATPSSRRSPSGSGGASSSTRAVR